MTPPDWIIPGEAPPDWVIASEQEEEDIFSDPMGQGSDAPLPFVEALEKSWQFREPAKEPEIDRSYDNEIPDWVETATPVEEGMPTTKDIEAVRPFRKLGEEEYRKRIISEKEAATKLQYRWLGDEDGPQERIFGGRAKRLAERMPFDTLKARRLMETARAAFDRENGIYTEDGARLIGEFLSDVDREKSLSKFEAMAELALEMPGFFIEIAGTSGGYTAANRGTQRAMIRALRKLGDGYLRKVARKKVGKVAGKVARWGVGSAALTAINPTFVSEQVSEENLAMALRGEEEDFVKALMTGIPGGFFELSSEMAGGVVVRKLSKVTGIDKMMTAAAHRWLQLNPRSKMAHLLRLKAKVGWHGILEEIEEERLADVMKGLAGHDPEFGTLGRLFSDNPEVRAKAQDQLLIEAGAFAMGGGGPAALQLGQAWFGKNNLDRLEAFLEDPSRTKYNRVAKIAAKMGPESFAPETGEEVLITRVDPETKERTTKPEPFDPDDRVHRQWFADLLRPEVESILEGLPEQIEKMFAEPKPPSGPGEEGAPPKPVFAHGGLRVVATGGMQFEGERELVLINPLAGERDDDNRPVFWRAIDPKTNQTFIVSSTNILSNLGVQPSIAEFVGSSENEWIGGRGGLGTWLKSVATPGTQVLGYPLQGTGEITPQITPQVFTLKQKNKRGDWETEEGATLPIGSVVAWRPAPTATPAAPAPAPAPAAAPAATPQEQIDELSSKIDDLQKKIDGLEAKRKPGKGLGKKRSRQLNAWKDRLKKLQNQRSAIEGRTKIGRKPAPAPAAPAPAPAAPAATPAPAPAATPAPAPAAPAAAPGAKTAEAIINEALGQAEGDPGLEDYIRLFARGKEYTDAASLLNDARDFLQTAGPRDEVVSEKQWLEEVPLEGQALTAAQAVVNSALYQQHPQWYANRGYSPNDLPSLSDGKLQLPLSFNPRAIADFLDVAEAGPEARSLTEKVMGAYEREENQIPGLDMAKQIHKAQQSSTSVAGELGITGETEAAPAPEAAEGPSDKFLKQFNKAGMDHPDDPNARLITTERDGEKVTFVVRLLKGADENSVTVDQILALEGKFKTGMGSDIVASLATLADEFQVTLGLHAVPLDTNWGKIPKKKLRQLYERFGFEKDVADWMVRKPTPAPEAAEGPVFDRGGFGYVPDQANQLEMHRGETGKGISTTMMLSDLMKLLPARINLENVEAIRKRIASGEAVAPPWLTVDVEDEDGKPLVPMQVSGHEGRGRALAMFREYGDIEVPVDLLFSFGSRVKDLAPGQREAPPVLNPRDAGQDTLYDEALGQAPEAEEPAREMIKGSATTIVVPGSDNVDATYALMELSDITASHKVKRVGPGIVATPEGNYPANLQPRAHEAGYDVNKVEDQANEKIAAYFISLHPDATSGPSSVSPGGVVINGNGRVMALQLAYGDWYTNSLRQNASTFGLKESDIDAMKQPVLVRVVEMDPTKEKAHDFARAGNQSATYSETPVRTAASLSYLVGEEGLVNALPWDSGDTLVKMLSNKAGKEFLQRVKNALNPASVESYFENGHLTIAGQELIENMFVLQAFDVDSIESIGDNAKYLKKALQGAVTEVLAIQRAVPSADIGPALAEAAVWIGLHPDRDTVGLADEFLASPVLPGMEVDPKDQISPAGRMMLDLLLQIGGKPRVFRGQMKGVKSALISEAEGMFASATDPHSKVIAEALRKYDIKERVGAVFGGPREAGNQQSPEIDKPAPEKATQVPTQEAKEEDAREVKVENVFVDDGYGVAWDITSEDTGEKVSILVYHGKGRVNPNQPYGFREASPLLGSDGRYYAQNANHAAMFGPDVTETTVVLENPLVVTTGNQLRGLAAQVASSDLYLVDPGTHAESEALGLGLREYATANGHDAIIINFPSAADYWPKKGHPDYEGNVKQLRRLFGQSQVFVIGMDNVAKAERKTRPMVEAEELDEIYRERLRQYIGQYLMLASEHHPDQVERHTPVAEKVMEHFREDKDASWYDMIGDSDVATMIEIAQMIAELDNESNMNEVLEETDQLQKGEKASDVESQSHVEQSEEGELESLARNIAQQLARIDYLDAAGMPDAFGEATTVEERAIARLQIWIEYTFQQGAESSSQHSRDDVRQRAMELLDANEYSGEEVTQFEQELPPITASLASHFTRTADSEALVELSGLSVFEGQEAGHVEHAEFHNEGNVAIWLVKFSKAALAAHADRGGVENLQKFFKWVTDFTNEEGERVEVFMSRMDWEGIQQTLGWSEEKAAIDRTAHFAEVELPIKEAIEHHLNESEDSAGYTRDDPGQLLPGGETDVPAGAVPAQHRMWHLRDPQSNTGRPLAAWKIIRRLALLPRLFGYKGATREYPMIMGDPIAQKGPNVRGVHWFVDQLIKVREADNAMTAFHEIGHAIETLLLGTGITRDSLGREVRKQLWTEARVGASAIRELENLGENLYGDKKPAGGYRGEGFAEFIRIYISNRALLDKVAPNMLEWWQNNVLSKHKAAARELDVLSAMVTRFQEQGALKWARGAMAVDPASFEARFDRFRDAISMSPNAIMRGLVDTLHPLAMFEKQYENTTGEKLDQSKSPYYWATALRLQHSAVVRYMVNEGMINFDRNPLLDQNKKQIPALRKVQELLNPKEYWDFAIYLLARRSLRVMMDKEKPLETPLTPELAGFIIDKLEEEHSNFGAAAEIVYDWNDGVLSYVAGADKFMADLVRSIRKREETRGDYVPLQRYQRRMNSVVMQMTGVQPENYTDVLHALRGSQSGQFIDPIQTSIANAERLVLAAHNRKVIDTMVAMSMQVQRNKHSLDEEGKGVFGFGNLIFEEVRTNELKAVRSLESLTKSVMKHLRNLKSVGEEVFLVSGSGDKLEINDIDFENQMIQFFGAAITPKNGKPIIPIRVGKQIKWYRMNAGIYNALSSMSADGLSFFRQNALLYGMFNLTFRTPARAFRAGTVGFRASFGLITNPLRDFQTLYLNTISSRYAFPLFIDYMWTYGEELLSAVTGGRYKSGYSDLWLRLGGEMARPLSQGSNLVKQAARDALESKRIGRRLVRYIEEPLKTPQHLWRDWNTFVDFLGRLIQFPESAARITEIKNVARDLNWDPSKELTPEIAQKLMVAGKQVTVDFTAAGSFARFWNQITPFFNATIQGPRSAARAARRRPLVYAWRGAHMATIALGMWSTYRDEDWWKKMDIQRKFLYLFVPVDVNGVEEVVQIPLSHDSGQLFAGVAIALADAAYRTEPDEIINWEQLGEFALSMAENHSPVDLPLREGPTGMTWAPTNAAGVLAKTAQEIGLNTKSYWNTPIVSPRFQATGRADARPRHEQFNEYTTTAAKWLGRIFEQSPQQIDHIATSVAGPGLRDLLLSAQSLDELFTKRKYQSASDWPLLGRVFRTGGKLGTRPQPVDKLYALHAQAFMRSGSDENPETSAQRHERLLLTDATKAMSLMFHIRAMTKDEKKRRAITKKISELADLAVSNVETMMMNREPFQMERALRERERDTMLMNRAYLEGDIEEAEEIRKQLFKQKEAARNLLIRGIPGIENASSEKMREGLRRYRRAKGIYSQ